MNEFRVKIGNYIKSSNSTSKLMRNLIISLIPIVIYSFYKNGIIPFTKSKDIYILFKPLIIILVSISTCLLSEFLWCLFTKKKKHIKSLIKESYSIIPGIFIGLIIPINTPISMVIVGSVFASIIGKMIYGGLGHNIFNPALIGRLFIITAYSSIIVKNGGYLNFSEQIDTIGGATPLTNFENLKYLGTYATVVQPYGNLWNFFIGNIPGCIGETSALLCLVGFFYLVYKKAIKWRIPLCYIFTVFAITSVIGFSNGAGIWYPLFQILSGGLFFGAVFMATDPVTSPITSYGQVLYGISLGVLTCLFRYLTPYPEGVLTSILIMNLLVPIYNKISIKTRFNKYLRYSGVVIILFIVFCSSLLISTSVKKDNTIVNNKTSNLIIVDEKTNGNEKIYEVKHKGFMSPTAIHANITIINNKVTNIEIISIDDHYYDSHIKNTDYLDSIIKSQNNLDYVDTISGATYTSKYLKEMVADILDYIGEK